METIISITISCFLILASFLVLQVLLSQMLKSYEKVKSTKSTDKLRFFRAKAASPRSSGNKIKKLSSIITEEREKCTEQDVNVLATALERNIKQISEQLQKKKLVVGAYEDVKDQLEEVNQIVTKNIQDTIYEENVLRGRINLCKINERDCQRDLAELRVDMQMKKEQARQVRQDLESNSRRKMVLEEKMESLRKEMEENTQKVETMRQTRKENKEIMGKLEEEAKRIEESLRQIEEERIRLEERLGSITENINQIRNDISEQTPEEFEKKLQANNTEQVENENILQKTSAEVRRLCELLEASEKEQSRLQRILDEKQKFSEGCARDRRTYDEALQKTKEKNLMMKEQVASKLRRIDKVFEDVQNHEKEDMADNNEDPVGVFQRFIGRSSR